MNLKKGLVEIYTGEGKGKTTAALGTALRAIGSGLKVAVVQFMKGGGITGEIISAQNYFPPNLFSFKQFGKGLKEEAVQRKIEDFEEARRDESDKKECIWDFNYAKRSEKQIVKEGIGYAKKLMLSGQWDVIILDELNNAIANKIIQVKDVLDLIKEKPENVEIIITGRNACKELIECADLVTEMKEIKHPFKKGILARRGIEF